MAVWRRQRPDEQSPPAGRENGFDLIGVRQLLFVGVQESSTIFEGACWRRPASTRVVELSCCRCQSPAGPFADLLFFEIKFENILQLERLRREDASGNQVYRNIVSDKVRTFTAPLALVNPNQRPHSANAAVQTGYGRRSRLSCALEVDPVGVGREAWSVVAAQGY